MATQRPDLKELLEALLERRHWVAILFWWDHQMHRSLRRNSETGWRRPWFWTRGDNSWYPVYERPWYPADIRLISLISDCWIRSKHAAVSSDFFWLLSTDIWLYLGISSSYFFNILLKSFRYLIEILSFLYPFTIPLISSWYPADILDILISSGKISIKMLPLGFAPSMLPL